MSKLSISLEDILKTLEKFRINELQHIQEGNNLDGLKCLDTTIQELNRYKLYKIKELAGNVR